MSTKKDFFISYTQTDADWAVWIDDTLKHVGYTTILQVCDQGLEDKVDFALRNSECFIAVLSQEYHDSPYCHQAWTAAYGKDTDYIKYLSTNAQTGLVKPIFIPVKIKNVSLKGLFYTRVYIPLDEYLYENKYERNDKEVKDFFLEKIKPRPFDKTDRIQIGEIKWAEKKNFINNLPSTCTPFFTGRTEILDLIAKNLKINNMISLIQSNGNLRGVGKTATAIEYAYNHENEYETIWWIDAGSLATVLSAYRDLVIAKKTVSEDAKDKDIFESMKYWFNNNKNWLFIYDNAKVEDFRDWLESCLPQQNGKGHVIITTRSNFFPKCKSLINVPVFKETEAMLFLKKRTDKNAEDYSDDSAKILAKYLQYTPLALEQAADYIVKNPGVTYSDCVTLIKKYGTDVFKKQ